MAYLCEVRGQKCVPWEIIRGALFWQEIFLFANNRIKSRTIKCSSNGGRTSMTYTVQNHFLWIFCKVVCRDFVPPMWNMCHSSWRYRVFIEAADTSHRYWINLCSVTHRRSIICVQKVVVYHFLVICVKWKWTFPKYCRYPYSVSISSSRSRAGNWWLRGQHVRFTVPRFWVWIAAPAFLHGVWMFPLR